MKMVAFKKRGMKLPDYEVTAIQQLNDKRQIVYN